MFPKGYPRDLKGPQGIPKGRGLNILQGVPQTSPRGVQATPESVPDIPKGIHKRPGNYNLNFIDFQTLDATSELYGSRSVALLKFEAPPLLEYDSSSLNFTSQELPKNAQDPPKSALERPESV